MLLAQSAKWQRFEDGVPEGSLLRGRDCDVDRLHKTELVTRILSCLNHAAEDSPTRLTEQNNYDPDLRARVTGGETRSIFIYVEQLHLVRFNDRPARAVIEVSDICQKFSCQFTPRRR